MQMADLSSIVVIFAFDNGFDLEVNLGAFINDAKC